MHARARLMHMACPDYGMTSTETESSDGKEPWCRMLKRAQYPPFWGPQRAREPQRGPFARREPPEGGTPPKRSATYLVKYLRDFAVSTHHNAHTIENTHRTLMGVCYGGLHVGQCAWQQLLAILTLLVLMLSIWCPRCAE